MRLLVDEDTQSRRQLKELVNAGHDVLSIGACGSNGISDADVLALAHRERRVVLTHNCADFQLLHRQGAAHHGIVAIYNYGDPSKNMNHQQVALAIVKLENSGVSIENNIHVLNAWR